MLTTQPQALQTTPRLDPWVDREITRRWNETLSWISKDETNKRAWLAQLKQFYDEAKNAGDEEAANLAVRIGNLTNRALASGPNENFQFTEEDKAALRSLFRYTDDGWLLDEPKPTQADQPRRKGFLDRISEDIGLDKDSLMQMLLLLLMMRR